MAHEVAFAPTSNGFIRVMRSFLKDAPRVVRSNPHDDINNLGVIYKVSGGGSDRAAGDILHIAPEVGCLRTIYRATCSVAGAGCSYGTTITPTVTFNVGARTIVRATGNWITDGFAAGNLIIITDAATAGNNRTWRILTITTTTNTNDTITLNTLDTLAASDAADVITATPVGGGAIFDVREDRAGANTHRGWMGSNIEFMSKNSSLWLYMTNGTNWAVGDYAEFTLESGSFTLYDEWSIKRTVTFDLAAGNDTIARSDYNGSFIRDGFLAGELIHVTGSASNNGKFLISTVTATLITLDAAETLVDEVNVSCTIAPRLRRTATFAVSPTNTLTRASGSWITDGFIAGGNALISEAVDSGNNGLFKIATVTALVITFDAAEVIAAETNDVITITPRNTVLNKWTEHRYRYSLTSGTTGDSTKSLLSGAQPVVPDTNSNYTSEWVGIAPGDNAGASPQTIYLGFQSQFFSTSRRNIEIRGFDAVSDSSFSAMGNASPPSYIYLVNSPSMDLFMTADGSHVTGVLDVNSSVSEPFYAGYGGVHGSQNQHPRPIFIGGVGHDSALNNSSTGESLRFFVRGADRTAGTDVNAAKTKSTCWHRWVDGQWLAVATFHENSALTLSAATNLNTELHTWPYSTNGNITFPFSGGLDTFQGNNDSPLANPNSRAVMPNAIRATPTTVTPNPNRQFPLLPVVVLMAKPARNVVADFRNIYYVPGDSQASKNRIIQGDYTYIVSQNHNRSGQEDFLALRLA